MDVAVLNREEDKEEMKIESIYDPEYTQVSKQKYDLLDYPQESIHNLNDSANTKKSNSSHPLIIVHPVSDTAGDHPPKKNKPEMEEERIEEEGPRVESHKENVQQKPGQGPASKLGTEVLEFIWNFIMNSYHLKSVTNQLIQSVK